MAFVKLPCELVETTIVTKDRQGNPLERPRHQAIVEQGDQRYYVDCTAEELTGLESKRGQSIELPVSVHPYNGTRGPGFNWRLRSGRK